MRRVYLNRCTTYDVDQIFQIMDAGFAQMGVYDRLYAGKTVVLKPNLIMKSNPEDAIITHPAVTAAVGLCVKKTGAKVLIAESPGGPYTPHVMKSLYRGCGYTEMAEHYGFDLYTDCKSREVFLPAGKICRKLSVIEPFLNADFIIDIAKLKTHGMTGFSGAVKNLFGVVPGLMKPELHCRYPQKEDFAEMLVDVCDFVKPDVCVIDGIYGMQGNGPTGGEKRFVGALLVSADPYAADMAATELINIRPEEILMLKSAAARGLAPESLSDITIVGETLAEMRITDYKRAKASSTDFIDRIPKMMRPLAAKLATPYPKVRARACIGCGKCAESCPQHVITVEHKKARIKLNGCIRCFCCHEMCPVHVIAIKRLGVFNL